MATKIPEWIPPLFPEDIPPDHYATWDSTLREWVFTPNPVYPPDPEPLIPPDAQPITNDTTPQ